MLIGALGTGRPRRSTTSPNYVALSIALANNNLQPSLNQSIRAVWLAFACAGHC